MTTEHFSFYAGYISSCPKCGERGGLMGQFTRSKGGKTWTGPYFRVCHSTQKYSKEKSKEKRDKLRKAGASPMEVRYKSKAHKTKHAYNCYLGKAGIVLAVKKIPNPYER